jgi:glycosyltransferase involved in cell wall biosynthesis
VPLGLLALSELARRRPPVEIALFGSHRPLPAPFRTTDLGLLDPANLADLYARATVGMAFSLTNPSLIPLEMMACGLPCVELATEPVLATFGTDGPLRLADPDPIQVCDAVLELLDDPARRERMGADGLALMRQRSWSAAADQVEAGLRAALVTAAPRGPGAM